MPSKVKNQPKTEEAGVDSPRTGKAYKGHSEQLSEPGNDESLSGLAHTSDGSPRYNHQNSSPLGEAPSVGNKAKPVNPKK